MGYQFQGNLEYLFVKLSLLEGLSVKTVPLHACENGGRPLREVSF